MACGLPGAAGGSTSVRSTRRCWPAAGRSFDEALAALGVADPLLAGGPGPVDRVAGGADHADRVARPVVGQGRRGDAAARAVAVGRQAPTAPRRSAGRTPRSGATRCRADGTRSARAGPRPARGG